MKAISQVDASLFTDAICKQVIADTEQRFTASKVLWGGWPEDFEAFVRRSVDWKASPGWPWKQQYPTNADLFGWDGGNVLPERVAMVEAAVRERWLDLQTKPKADPIYCFIKPEPHKITKRDKKAWRLISAVGLTDTLIDRILYGDWLDAMIHHWIDLPSKAGWSPQQGGYRWLAKTFRGKTPMSIDKSSWDWTVNEHYVRLIQDLIPRMIFKRTPVWDRVYKHRFEALFYANNPIFRMACGCEFTQLVTGIQKSGCLGTIGFNSVWQYMGHLLAGGDPDDVIHCLGDDTAQEAVFDTTRYTSSLEATGVIVKECDVGWPITFAGHVITEDHCEPAYGKKHAFALQFLEPKIAQGALESYRHLYALKTDTLAHLTSLQLDLHGPSGVISNETLKDWYLAYEGASNKNYQADYEEAIIGDSSEDRYFLDW